MTDVWAGADLGSTNVKVLLADAEGTVLARAARPTPRAGLRVRPDELVDVLEELILLAAGAVSRPRLRGVCVAGVGEDGVLHAGGRPLGTALPWFAPSRRVALDRLAELARPGDRLRYGVELDAARTVAAWALIPSADLAAADGWVACTDYPALRWTGRAIMSSSLAPRTGAWLLDPGEWDIERAGRFLPADLLPPVVPAGTVVGELRSRRLADLLASDAVVVAGGHDHPVGASVVHRQDPGAPLDSMGTAEVLVRTLEPANRPARTGDRRTEDRGDRGDLRTGVLRTGDLRNEDRGDRGDIRTGDRRTGGNPPPGVDLSPAVLGDGLTALTVLELDRNMTWLRDNGLGPCLDAVLAGRLVAERPDRPVFAPGAAGGEPPRWTPAAADLSAEARAAGAAWQLAQAGATALRALAPDAEAAYAAGGWTRAPGWMRLKAAAAGLPYRILAEPELSALGAAHLCLPGPIAPVSVRELTP
ncbi:FGGY family carbohydrate kinase [Nonomuraea sp. AD125B]|uniref:FGGY family carbohydrate kinase n=1 Tax=Nonomuraea sp. AD125B TaxID=3242897 RepID=UPI0035272642